MGCRAQAPTKTKALLVHDYRSPWKGTGNLRVRCVDSWFCGFDWPETLNTLIPQQLPRILHWFIRGFLSDAGKCVVISLKGHGPNTLPHWQLTSKHTYCTIGKHSSHVWYPAHGVVVTSMSGIRFPNSVPFLILMIFGLENSSTSN